MLTIRKKGSNKPYFTLKSSSGVSLPHKKEFWFDNLTDLFVFLKRGIYDSLSTIGGIFSITRAPFNESIDFSDPFLVSVWAQSVNIVIKNDKGVETIRPISDTDINLILQLTAK